MKIVVIQLIFHFDINNYNYVLSNCQIQRQFW